MDSITNIFRSIATNEIDQIFNAKNKLKSLLIQSCSGEFWEMRKSKQISPKKQKENLRKYTLRICLLKQNGNICSELKSTVFTVDFEH